MSGPKHTPWTPGPWGYGVPVKGGRAVVADANGNVVCVVEGGPLRREVTIANAQLIAAAPRLAKALRLTLAALISSPEGELLATYGAITDRLLGVQAAIDDARAALREAGVE